MKDALGKAGLGRARPVPRWSGAASWVALAAFALGAAPNAPMPAGRGTVAGHVRIVVDGVERQDASGVVVYLTGFTEPPPPAKSPELVQRDRHFWPPLLAITAGQEVVFPNGDPFFHNVFSVSPGQRFDLGQYKSGEVKTRLFREPGPVEVYCNIHPEMAATILVLPNRRFATTASDGSFLIEGVPAGTFSMYAYDRLSSAPVRTDVVVNAGEASTVELTVAETRKSLRHKNKYGEEYRDPEKYR